MPGDWKQMIQEKAVEAAVITAFNYVPGLVAKGITLARNGIEWLFGGRNKAESDWVGKIGEVAEKAENVLAEYERKELMSWTVIDPKANKKRRWLGRQRMASTVAEFGEIEEEEESHEFCLGAGDPRVVGNESRSVSSKRKGRGYCNYNYDDLMILPGRGLEEDPQRFCTYKYGDDGRFTLIYSTTTPQLKWTYPGTDGSGLPFTFVSFNGFEGGRTCLRLKGTCVGSTTEAVLGTERCKLIHVVDLFPRPYMLTVDAWADSSSGRWTFVFSVLPLPSDSDGLKFLTRAVRGRRGFLPGPQMDIISNENKEPSAPPTWRLLHSTKRASLFGPNWGSSLEKKIVKVQREDCLLSVDYKIENCSMLFIGSSCSLDLLVFLTQWLKVVNEKLEVLLDTLK